MLECDGSLAMFAPVAARRQGRDFKESGTLSLMTFAALLVTQKRDKRKVTLCLLRVVVGADPCKVKSKSANSQIKNCRFHPVSAQTSTRQHPNSNREVRRSLTWHSSKSESALERFELKERSG